MDRLRFLASAALLLSAFLWTNCADAERPPQAPPVRALECECPSCNCGDSCLCLRAVCDGPAKCECPTCKDRLQVQVAAEPIQIIDVWASYCPPCVAMKPDFEAVAKEFPGLMSMVDAEANPEWVASKGVRTIPAILVMQGDKVLARYQGRMNREQLRAVARRWKE